MKSRTQMGPSTVGLLALAGMFLFTANCVATSWTFTIDSSCTVLNCNSSGTPITGTWTATESVSGATFSTGTYTRPSPGFLELTVPSGASAGTGTWVSTPPFTIYAIEVPGIGIISADLLTSETQPIVMVENASCAGADFTGNFVISQWTASMNDLASGSQVATGDVQWTNSSSTLTVNHLFNSTGFSNFLGSAFGMGAGSCGTGANAGQYTISGTGDRGGTLWVSNQNALIYKSNANHTMFVVPDKTIPNANSLIGTYAGIRYDSNTADATPILPMRIAINSAGSQAVSQKLSNPYTGTIDSGSPITETFTISAINSPRQGMVTGTLAGTYTGNLACAVILNVTNGVNTKNAFFCAGQSPTDSGHHAPFNLVMVSATDAPGGIDYSLNSTGADQIAFGSMEDSPNSLTLQTDGKFVAGGYSQHSASVYYYALARFNSDGSIDSTFGTSGKVTTIVGSGTRIDQALGVSMDPTSGKIVAGGTTQTSATQYKFSLARYNTDGTLDNTFGTSGKNTVAFASWRDSPASAVVQGDGKPLLVGFSNQNSGGTVNNVALARYTTTGILDTTFGTSGKLLTAIGTLDDKGTFAVLQTDGKIVVAGLTETSTTGPAYSFAFLRYTTAGTLDTTFNSTGIATTSIGSLHDALVSAALQTDGKIVGAGYTTLTTTPTTAAALVRYNTDGSIDSAFGSSGKVSCSFGTMVDKFLGVTIQPDGKIVGVGYSQISSTVYHFAVGRFNTDGSLDTTFNGTGKVTAAQGSYMDELFSAVVDFAGNLAVIGHTDVVSGSVANFVLVRFWH